jgi:Icc-related predicted phosphoesterase
MKVLACGDVHSQFKKMMEIIEKEKPDILLNTGDWGMTENEEVALMTLENNFNEILRSTRIITIYGNHDDLPAIKSFKHPRYTWLEDGVVTEIGRHKFLGINGNFAETKKEPWHKLEEEIESYNVDNSVEFVLSHECPLGYADTTPTDTQGGFSSLAQYLLKLKPAFWLCGHLHKQQIGENKNTMVINSGGVWQGEYAIINIDYENLSAMVDLKDL